MSLIAGLSAEAKQEVEAAEAADPFLARGEAPFQEPTDLDDPRVRAALAMGAQTLRWLARAPGEPPEPRRQVGKQGSAWTAEEERRLVAAFEAGQPLTSLAAAHQRTTSAIRSRLGRLGLVERTGPEADAAFLSDFEAGRLLRRRWDHRARLRVLRQCLLDGPVGAAVERLRSCTPRLAGKGEAGPAYHETSATAWAMLVADAMTDGDPGEGFAAFAERHPALLERALILRYYSRERLLDPAGRLRFLPPDRHPLPEPPAPWR